MGEKTDYTAERCTVELRTAGRGWRIGRRLLLWSLLALPISGASLLFLPSFFHVLWLLLVPVIACGLWFFFRLRDIRHRITDCRVEVRDGGLRVPGERDLAWSSDRLETGWPAGASGAVVRLTNGAEVAITGLPEDSGETLLQHLGLDPSLGMADFKVRGALSHHWMGSSVGRVIGVLVVLGAYQVPAQGLEVVSLMLKELSPLQALITLSLFLICFLVVEVITWRYLFYRTATVGTDGLAITGGWSRRYIPLSAVASVEEGRNGVAWLQGHDGGRVDINPTAHFKFLRRGPDSGLAARIEWAVSHRSGGSSRAVAAAVERQGAEVAAWRRDLLALARQSGGYRTMALEPKLLLEVIWDRRRSVEARVGAAVVVSTMGGEEMALKVRQAAAASGNWYLRTALLLAADGKIQEGPLAEASALARAPFPARP